MALDDAMIKKLESELSSLFSNQIYSGASEAKKLIVTLPSVTDAARAVCDQLKIMMPSIETDKAKVETTPPTGIGKSINVTIPANVNDRIAQVLNRVSKSNFYFGEGPSKGKIVSFSEHGEYDSAVGKARERLKFLDDAIGFIRTSIEAFNRDLPKSIEERIFKDDNAKNDKELLEKQLTDLLHNR